MRLILAFVLMLSSALAQAPAPAATVATATPATPAPEDRGYSFPPVREQLDGGVIDWTTWRLEASAASERAVGAWKDRRVQEQDALDRLAPRILTLAPQVRVTPDATAGDLMNKEDDLGVRLREGLGTWRVVETRYVAPSRVEMDATLDLLEWLRPALVSLGDASAPLAPTGDRTGVLVDVRGLGFKPCLAPRIQGEQGQVVFDVGAVSVDAIRRAPPVIYVPDPADPRAMSRAGERPIFARGASATADGDIVLDAADLAALSGSPDFKALASAGRVVIVVDP